MRLASFPSPKDTSFGNDDLAAIVRSLGAETLTIGIEERFAAGQPDDAGRRAMANAGLLGLTIPSRYGGQGRDYLALATICEELARIDLSYQITVTVHLALASMAILQWGTAAQRDTWLPPLARGERLATFALTEPDAGSDVTALRARASPDRAGFRLQGEKTWISEANEASLFLVFATLDPCRRHHGITAFLVPRETEGVTTTQLRGKLGVRAGDTGSVILDNAWVSSDHVLGELGEGFPIALSTLSTGLFTVGCGALGAARDCVDRTLALLHAQSSAPPVAEQPQWLKRQLASVIAGEARSRLLLHQAALLKNAGQPSQQATSLAKWTAATVALVAAETSLHLHQVLAPGAGPAVERQLRNIRGSVIYGGTTQIHEAMQGAYALGDRTDRPFRCATPTANNLR